MWVLEAGFDEMMLAWAQEELSRAIHQGAGRPRDPGRDHAVGVVVFDATSGRLVTLNREARRIVKSLRTPGRPSEQLQEVVTFRRTGGWCH